MAKFAGFMLILRWFQINVLTSNRKFTENALLHLFGVFVRWNKLLQKQQLPEKKEKDKSNEAWFHLAKSLRNDLGLKVCISCPTCCFQHKVPSKDRTWQESHNNHESLILKTQGFLTRYQVPIRFTINSHLQEFYIQSWKCWNLETSWFSKKIQGILLFRRSLLFQFSCLKSEVLEVQLQGFQVNALMVNVIPSFSGTKISRLGEK